MQFFYTEKLKIKLNICLFENPDQHDCISECELGGGTDQWLVNGSLNSVYVYLFN